MYCLTPQGEYGTLTLYEFLLGLATVKLTVIVERNEAADVIRF